ncbi:MAG: autotransporter outer membrane beta-barrel domain-containing protein, partial [Fibrobacteres bacterium]|nr:autotransporter outer membrane beta-barrel domain-containing protein [Fibrobacterota bacterium]
MRVLNEQIENKIDASFERIPSSGESRISALEALGRQVTTRKLSESMIAAWLGHKPVENIINIVKKESRVSKQISVSSSCALMPIPASTTLFEEVGGIGENDGIIESGEWVKIGIMIKNQSDQPWFSTSAFLESLDPYVYIRPESEIELGEMHTKETGVSLTEWVYVSTDCPSNHPIDMRVKLNDTWNSSKEPCIAKFTLQPLQIIYPLSANATLDTDMPGSSDLSDVKDLAPLIKFEYLQNFSNFIGVPTKATVQYSLPIDVSGMFKSFGISFNKLSQSADGKLLRATDDIDAEIATDDKVRTTFNNLSNSKHWFPNGKKGRVWIAADVDLRIPQPGTILDTGKKPLPPACPPEWPDGKTLLSIFNNNLSLEAHPVKAVLPKAIAAVDGIELTCDTAGFLRDYAELYPKSAKVEATQVDSGLFFRFRVYSSLPFMRMARATAKPAPEPTPEPIAEPVEHKFYNNRVFVQPFGLVLENGSGFVVGFDRRLSPQRSILGIFQFNYAKEIMSSGNMYQSYDVNSYNLGLGYRMYKPISGAQPYLQGMAKLGTASYGKYPYSGLDKETTSRMTLSALVTGGINFNANHFYMTLDAGTGLAFIQERNINPSSENLEYQSTSPNGNGYYAYSRNFIGLK